MPMKISRLVQILCVLIVPTVCVGVDAARSPARALGIMSCTFTMSNEAFGNIDVLQGTAFSTNATLNINCTGASILPTTVFVCIAFPTPLAMSGPAPSTLQYGLLGPPPATTSWSNTTPIAVPVSGNIVAFSANATIQIPATLFANQQSAQPGSNYVQTVTATASYSTTTCTSGLIVGTASFTFQATATVLKSCNVAAGNLNFGTTGNLTAAITGQSEIDVQCSNGMGYAIALNGGLTGATDPTQRKMTFGSGTVTYGLYQDGAFMNPWGSTAGSNVVGATGTSLSQPFKVYGKVPVQPTPPIGTYTDTIVVSVSY